MGPYFLSLPELLFILQNPIYWCLLVHPILIPFNIFFCVSYAEIKLKHLNILCHKMLHKSLWHAHMGSWVNLKVSIFSYHPQPYIWISWNFITNQNEIHSVVIFIWSLSCTSVDIICRGEDIPQYTWATLSCTLGASPSWHSGHSCNSNCEAATLQSTDWKCNHHYTHGSK